MYDDPYEIVKGILGEIKFERKVLNGLEADAMLGDDGIKQTFYVNGEPVQSRFDPTDMYVLNTSNMEQVLIDRINDISIIAEDLGCSIANVIVAIRDAASLFDVEDMLDRFKLCILRVQADELMLHKMQNECERLIDEYVREGWHKNHEHTKCKRGTKTKPHGKGIYWHRVRSFCYKKGYH